MSMYQPNIPTGFLNLDVDFQNIQNNFSQLDTSFGIDHYKYSDQTANNGFHNQVSTPSFVDSPSSGLPPVTTATLPIFYGFLQAQMGSTLPIGTIQWSRGWDQTNGVPEVPTPLTSAQSSVNGITITTALNINILDFTGLNRCAGVLVAWDFATTTLQLQEYLVVWDNGTISIQNVVSVGGILRATSTNNILQLRNNGLVDPGLTNVYWTFKFYRVN